MSVPQCTLLVVDDEHYILTTLSHLLAADFVVFTADSADAAQEAFARQPIDIILSDQKMPRTTGVQLLEWVREHHPSTVRLLMTGYVELEDAIAAINRGHVYHYLLKPWRAEELRQVLRHAAEKVALERNRDELLEQMRQLNRDLERRVAERTRELQESNHLLEQRSRELERLALTDPLTGLFNRRALEELARFELKRHARYPSPADARLHRRGSLQTSEHALSLTGGDEVLRGLARILTGTLREVDSVGRVGAPSPALAEAFGTALGEADSVGRIGGEEFLVIVRETNYEGADQTGGAHPLDRGTDADPYMDHSISITVSIGFAVAEVGVPVDFLEMLKVAASGVQHAKDAGRNRCRRPLHGAAARASRPSIRLLRLPLEQRRQVEFVQLPGRRRASCRTPGAAAGSPGRTPSSGASGRPG